MGRINTTVGTVALQKERKKEESAYKQQIKRFYSINLFGYYNSMIILHHWSMTIIFRKQLRSTSLLLNIR